MAVQNPKVDDYLAVGCGRCPLGDTPDCKVHPWADELKELRRILLDTDLTEEVKWSVPCYTYNGSNILLLSAFKGYASVSFFKGSLLQDPHGVLIQPTENSQASRLFRFTDVEQILAIEAIIKEYVAEAIAIEKAGIKVEYKDTKEYDFPDELVSAFEDDPTFAAAFESLTPGRQRGYLLHFSAAKQSKTREARIERCMPKIFEGKGFNER